VASLYQFLRKIHEPLDFYIPHRYREGYGISKAGIDFAKENGFTLIISLDCGIKSVDHIGYAKGLGIEFVVCDHHLPDEELPPAYAILNPKQKDCKYPYKELCGCGVGFKLMTALGEFLKLPPEASFAYLDLVATAIANECNANFKVSSFNISYVYESLLTVCRVLNSSRCSSVNQKQMSAKLSIKLVLQLLASCVLVHSMAPCTPWHDAFAIHTWMLAFAWWFYFASYF